ncbi:MAG TPA: alpha/beta fold hydrolase [Mycobacteriales bacterium]|nr:alpha/beta fold hydrolase [Mycobacteriales bacterium]
MTLALAPVTRVDGLHVVVLGDGGPVTVFAHGLGGSVAETRPLATRVDGTRVLFDLPGHGDSDALTDGWDYDLLADALLSVADAFGATRAVGLSLGAGALLRALTRAPDRFARLAFVLPAAIDGTRRDGATERLRVLGDAIANGDADSAAEFLLGELPESVRSRRGIELLVRRRALQLVSKPAPEPAYDDRPVHDRAQLRTWSVPALVIGQEADALHPVALARELHALLPSADLAVYPQAGVFWTAARDAQEALARHLAEN